MAVSDTGGAPSSHVLAATGLNQPSLCLKQALGERWGREGAGSDFMVQHQALCWHQIKKIIKLFTGEKEEITSVKYPRIDMYRLVTFCVVRRK